MSARKIVHVDADCFYAAVEVRDNGKLLGRPVAVGGDPGGRGVIATCSYEARRSGVRSAMASSTAKRLCPELIIVRPDIKKYKAISQEIMSILGEYSEALEPLSLDEAYLDVSHAETHRGSATLIAKEIKARVKNEVGLTVSAGIAPVKFLAKIASDWLKPDGLFVVLPAQVEPFTAELAVGKLPGVGPVTLAKLHRYGLYRCRDIRSRGEIAMVDLFGAFGEDLYRRAWGVDEREVAKRNTRRSLSVERTFDQDLQVTEVPRLVTGLLVDLNERLQRLPARTQIKKLSVKLKFDNFQQTTMESAIPNLVRDLWLTQLDGGNNSSDVSHFAALQYYHWLSMAAWGRVKRPVRLLGLGVGLAADADDQGEGATQYEQLQLSNDW